MTTKRKSQYKGAKKIYLICAEPPGVGNLPPRAQCLIQEMQKLAKAGREFFYRRDVEDFNFASDNKTIAFDWHMPLLEKIGAIKRALIYKGKNHSGRDYYIEVLNDGLVDPVYRTRTAPPYTNIKKERKPYVRTKKEKVHRPGFDSRWDCVFGGIEPPARGFRARTRIFTGIRTELRRFGEDEPQG